MIVLDLIKGSLRLIGALSTGETPEAPESNEAMQLLNELLETLSIGTLSTWSQPTQTFTLVPSQQTYTIGPAANFNTVKPERIIDAYVTDAGISYPVAIVSQEYFDAISYKAQPSPYPCYLVYQGTPTAGNIILWPSPNKAVTLTINCTTLFTPFATLSDTVLWPNGYTRMIRYLLAKDLASEYGIELSREFADSMNDAVAAVKRLNNKTNTPICYDQTLTGNHSYNQLIVGISGGYQ
jgi:hypothetical protein